jgi:CRISPR-associated protein Cas1
MLSFRLLTACWRKISRLPVTRLVSTRIGGFYHQMRHGRPGLALELMEPFRPLIADSAVLSAINTKMVTEKDFVRAGGAVGLTASGRKGFFRAYELRMDSLVTHPLFEYRLSYRRLLEIQARLLARVIEGEIPSFPVFVTRSGLASGLVAPETPCRPH